MSDTKGVYKKLARARVLLLANNIPKSGLNKFAGYKYYELGDFIPKIMEIFDAIYLCGTVNFGKDEATLTITDTEDGSQIVFSSPVVEASMKGALPIQQLGATQTYMRRYLWVVAMEIAEHDAVDATADGKAPAKPVNPNDPGKELWETANDEQKAFLVDCLSSIREDITHPEAAAHKFYVSLKLDMDEQGAIWSQLGSTERASIKKFKPVAK